MTNNELKTLLVLFGFKEIDPGERLLFMQKGNSHVYGYRDKTYAVAPPYKALDVDQIIGYLQDRGDI